MRIDKNNPDHAYTILNTELALTAQKRNPGLVLDSSLKESPQCVVETRRWMRWMENKPESIILPIQKTLGNMCRVLFEQLSIIWYSYFKIQVHYTK